MMSKKISLFIIGIVATTISTFAAPPAGYYDSALNKSGYELKTALHHIIKGQKRFSYGSGNCTDCVWGAYRTTDINPDGTVREIYTTPGVYHFGFHTDSLWGYQCGNTNVEGGQACAQEKNTSCKYCYSREHSFPKSWWDDQSADNTTDSMYTDLNHLFPADQYINANHHNNYSLGETDSPSATSILGYKRGYNKLAGYTGLVFEPIDEYKGYFARIYLYMATRYENKIAGWIYKCDTNSATNPGTDKTRDLAKRDVSRSNSDALSMLNGTSTQCFTDWAKDMLVRWHNAYPVQDWERARNDSVYKIQYNRNPFIDHPELVNKIWGSDNTPFGETPSFGGYSIKYRLKKNNDIIEEKSFHIPGTEVVTE